MLASAVERHHATYDGESELPLFGNCPAQLHMHERSNRIDILDSVVQSCENLQYSRKSHGNRLLLVQEASSIQLLLPLTYQHIICLNESIAQFQDYIRRSRFPLMTHSFWSLIARQPKLSRLAETLYQMDKTMIGDVVQMTAAELATDASASPKEIELLINVLKDADLRLGSKIANWSSLRAGRSR